MMVRVSSWVRVDDDVAVGVVGAHPEDLAAAHAVEGLRMVSPWASMKALMSAAAQATRVGGANCGNSVMASFGVVADRPRVVEDARAGLHGALQQPGGGDVFEVEGRVLAHQHRVEGGEGRVCSGPGIPGVVEVGQGQRVAARRHGAGLPDQRLALDGEDSWPRRAAARIMAMLESL
jgi:hypothetical protein